MADLSGSLGPQTLGGMGLALLLALLLGGLIGLEREIRGHPAGLRTHILVCTGSTLITLVSSGMTSADGHLGDPARLSAPIVAGIGFLGAGAIIREGMSVRGLTTAASVWVTAGVGIAVGAGPRFGALAAVATVLILGTLWVLQRVDTVMRARGYRPLVLDVVVDTADGGFASELLALVADRGIHVEALEWDNADRGRRLLLRLAPSAKVDAATLVAAVADMAKVRSVRLD
jgi:putative Mg2+ transporter-C (MgtC) family protein